MSEPNQIPKILEGFTIGEAITSHDGVVCYPAIENNTDEKFILKSISLPASNVQLAALQLSGAYRNRAEALAYYREIAQEILKENRVMNELSNLEGFTPYLSCQLKEKPDGNGYEVWLLARYQHSLEQTFSENVMTHQGIMDLAMDLCSALAACRRAGYLYIDLKPGNIFLDPSRGYRIADLGFTPLVSLKYASLPDKYRSIYTAPEITDGFSQLNTTLDVYALGLVLYQAYNGGILPLEDGKLPAELLPPMYADYEMAQIILTACDPNPENRWQDPTAFGQALVQYMQNYGVSSASIIPAPVTTPELDLSEEFLPEADVIDPSEWEDIPELAFMQELVSDDTAPTVENTLDIRDTTITDEATAMLAHVEELIAHEMPKADVKVEMVHVPIPEPIVVTSPDEVVTPPVVEPPVADIPVVEPPVADIPLEEQTPVDEPLPIVASEPVVEEPEEGELPAVTPASEEVIEKPMWLIRKNIVRAIVVVLALFLTISLTVIGVQYYQNTYLQHIDQILLSGTVNSIRVQLVTDIDESLLQVTCSDTYGNAFTSEVKDGIANFTGLTPQTRYTIRITISGTHKLTGALTDTFTTASQTTVSDLTASIGPQDGSVYLNFSVSGVECDEWVLTYASENALPQQLTFAGHSVTVYDLLLDETYTFTLSAGDDSNVVGDTTVQFVTKAIPKALNPVITACGNGTLTVQWQQPEGQQITQWVLHCFDSSGYDHTVVTTGTSYTFQGLTHDTPCTVQITADGMPQGISVSVGAHPTNIADHNYSLDDQGNLVISWENTGVQPEGGWLVNWFCDGMDLQQLESTENTITLPYIPGGTYTISLIAADYTPILGHTFTITVEDAPSYTGHGITASAMHFTMCAVPNVPNWTLNDVPQDSYKTEFQPGEKAGFVVWSDTDVEASADVVTIIFLIRSEDGKLMNVTVMEMVWDALWSQNMCQLELPYMPHDSGSYTVHIYLDGMLAISQEFTI